MDPISDCAVPGEGKAFGLNLKTVVDNQKGLMLVNSPGTATHVLRVDKDTG